MRVDRWLQNGWIVRGVVTGRDETSVAMLTFFRCLSLALTVTELGGVHLTFSVRLFMFEAALGIALWEKAVQ